VGSTLDSDRHVERRAQRCWLTQWNQLRIYKQQASTNLRSAIREERREQILKFVDAAQAGEEVAEKANPKDPSTGSFVHGGKPERASAVLHRICSAAVHQHRWRKET
jgi:hypothetical protein